MVIIVSNAQQGAEDLLLQWHSQGGVFLKHPCLHWEPTLQDRNALTIFAEVLGETGVAGSTLVGKKETEHVSETSLLNQQMNFILFKQNKH